MKKEQPLDVGLDRERNDIVQTAMAPAKVLLVFLAVILRVHHQHLGASQKLHQLLLFAPSQGGVRRAPGSP